MLAMNIMRIGVSIFILILFVITAAGWVWTGRNQPGPQANASHIVLTLGALAGAVCLVALWRPRVR